VAGCPLQADPDLTPAPIGLCFASLRYSERLYPVVFAALALRVISARLENSEQRR